MQIHLYSLVSSGRPGINPLWTLAGDYFILFYSVLFIYLLIVKRVKLRFLCLASILPLTKTLFSVFIISFLDRILLCGSG